METKYCMRKAASTIGWWCTTVLYTIDHYYFKWMIVYLCLVGSGDWLFGLGLPFVQDG